MLWGIDLGGTKIEGVVISSLEDREPVCRLRVDTEAAQGYQHIVGQIGKLVELMKKESGDTPTLIGFGTPGTLTPATGLLKNSNTTCLNGMPLKKDIEEKLSTEIVIQNDANCFALAEAKWGAAQGAESVFGVIMGTGVGGGLVINGSSINGKSGIAGEWGHNVLVENGPDCYCGKSGCVETILSGPALERYYEKVSGKKLSLKDIAAEAEKGDNPDAKETIDHLNRNFAKAISVVLNIFDPEVVVLGGGVSNVDSLYSAGAELVSDYIFNDQVENRIVKNELGDSAGVFGAAFLTRPGS